jgi:hypothetical protein
MNHYYEFFDRAAVDRLWLCSWKTVMKRNRSRWFNSTGLNREGYDGESLRELLAFSVEPQPSDKQVERMLASLTVSATVRRCHPQFWVMDEIMRQVLSHPAHSIFSVELSDISGLIAVASRAFLDRRIGTATLWTVAKLHSSKLSDRLRLDSKQAKSIESALPWRRMWEPIYSWQNERACIDDEWTNCLGVSDTRRFADFVMSAHRENWSAVPLDEESHERREVRRFRDFADCVVLARVLRRKLASLRRPCVYRMWE